MLVFKHHHFCLRHLHLPFPPKLNYLLTTNYQSKQPISTLSSLLNLCNNPNLLKQFHARLILHGHHQNPSLSSKLFESYSKIGFYNYALRVFNAISCPSFDLYNRVLQICTLSGEFEKTLLFYNKMVSNFMYPDEISYPFVVRSCKEVNDVKFGKRVHGHLFKLGFDSNDGVVDALVEFYDELGSFENARQMFDEMPVRGLDYWNSRILNCLRDGNVYGSFLLFKQMMEESIQPDSINVINLVRASVELKSKKLGVSVHGLIVVSGHSGDLGVSTALLTMYSKLGCLENAILVFEQMLVKDNVVWNLMISAYCRYGHPRKSLDLVGNMISEGMRMDLFTALATVTSIGELNSPQLGRQVHGYCIRNGLDCEVSVLNSLIDMYCKCNNVEIGRKVFESVSEKTEVSWSTIIKGHVKHGQYSEALSLFVEMKSDGFRLDSPTILTVLPACVNSSALELVKYVHGIGVKLGLCSTPSVNTELLVSYAKCGCIEMARKLFDEDEIISKDIITWNSMISAYSKHGEWQQCFALYEQLKDSYLRPDNVTFLGLLTACVNSGRVEEGWKVFQEIKETYGYQPSQEHYACMVDLLGRAGYISQATNLINSMACKPDARVWGPLLSACRKHPETEVAELAAEKLISLEPKNAGNYVLLSNVYAANGKWDKVAKLRSFLREKGLKKIPGMSWLEVNGKTHEFRVADRSHPMSDDIYSILGFIEIEIEDTIKLGVANSSAVFQEIEY
ncbi:pentatricopeptide repeat-containing protein At4g19191, mitochondrial-like [Silene latifolia]|uniref:pentatricopeptide repeat-containing protein At4g19191, mitochondrial-like n=1 Tax=Silene latifolia TaxID=37657 RepID=UPI003D7886BD